MTNTIPGTAAIFTREIVARRDLLLAAAAIALIVLILPFLPGMSGFDHADIWAMSSFILAFATGIFFAIGLGATVFGSDLSEQRLGFYFDRPVSSTSIWFGRLIAVFVLILGCELIVLLPGLTAAFSRLQLTLSEVRLVRFQVYAGGPIIETVSPAVLFVAVPAFLLLLSHCISIMLRARTVWLLLDLVGVVAVGVAGWIIARPFIACGFYHAALSIGLCLLVGLIPVLLAAAAVGVANGRTGIGRTHRFVSLTLWVSSVGAIGLMASYASWLERIEPADLVDYRLQNVSGDGRWAEVDGFAVGHKDIFSSFLVATTGNRYFKLPMGALIFFRDWRRPISVDGTYAVWGQRFGGDDTQVLWWVDLEGSPIEPVATTITAPGNADVKISPDGGSVAIRQGQILSVYDLKTEELLTVVPMHGDTYSFRWQYLGADTIRLVQFNPTGEGNDHDADLTTVFDLAVEKGARPVTNCVVEGSTLRWGNFTPDLRFFLAINADRKNGRSEPRPVLTVYDAGSGDAVRQITRYFVGFLPNDRFWSIQEYEPGKIRASIESLQHEGVLKELDLDDWPSDVFLGLLPTGDIVLAADDSPNLRAYDKPWASIEIIDAETGQRHHLGSGLSTAGATHLRQIGAKYPLKHLWGTYYSTVLFQHPNGTVFTWDSDRNQLIPIAGQGPG